MNGVHDMGGLQNTSPIPREPHEPIFHAEWERRIFALFLAMPGIDWPYRRFQIESIPPADYLGMSYYERWLTALSQILIETGHATASEIERGTATSTATHKPPMLGAAEVATWLAPDKNPKPKATARFKAGDCVRARNRHLVGHTRLPGYVRGKVGTIERDADIEELQDSDIEGLGAKLQHVYTVRFAARELWGKEASARDSVYVAMWEGYLDPA